MDKNNTQDQGYRVCKCRCDNCYSFKWSASKKYSSCDLWSAVDGVSSICVDYLW